MTCFAEDMEQWKKYHFFILPWFPTTNWGAILQRCIFKVLFGGTSDNRCYETAVLRREKSSIQGQEWQSSFNPGCWTVEEEDLKPKLGHWELRCSLHRVLWKHMGEIFKICCANNCLVVDSWYRRGKKKTNSISEMCQISFFSLSEHL